MRMPDLAEVIRNRHSARVPFDPDRPIPERDLAAILEVARWAPTAHNMQNFAIIVVDDRAALAAIAAIPSRPSETFLRENYRQLSFSESELRRRGTGLLAEMFPPSWRSVDAKPEAVTDARHSFLGGAMQHCPMLLIVTYDRRLRAPASEGDLLGIMSLGAVMQNMWLMAEARGLSLQVLSVLASADVEPQLRTILTIPAEIAIAFACRLGYPAAPPGSSLRVRRPVREFVYRNRFGHREEPRP